MTTGIAVFALSALLGMGAPQGPLTSPHGAARNAEPPTVTESQYRVFTSDGKQVSLDELVAAMADVDVVFIGEEHDDPGAHFLEAELLRRAHGRYAAPAAGANRRPVALSLEMFERDVQPIVDEYLAGHITERHFLSSSRPWPRYRTDYRPMVEFAREHQLPVIAANAPGRYSNRAARLGRASLESLPDSAKAWLPPLPYGQPDPAYAAKFEALMNEGMKQAMEKVPHTPEAKPIPAPEAKPAPVGDEKPAAAPQANPHGGGPHGMASLLDGQVLWDATMAWSIAEHLMRDPGALVLHVNGKFHSEEHLGIPTQLERYRPGTRTLVVTALSGQGFPNFDVERLGKLGDFVILTDPSLKKEPAESSASR